MKKIEDFLYRHDTKAISIVALVPAAVWWGPLYFFTDYFLTPGTDRLLDLTSASLISLMFSWAIVDHLRKRGEDRYIQEHVYDDQPTESLED